MTMFNSSYTGRAPRSMKEAFNPYADNTLHPMKDERDYRLSDAAMILVGAIAIAVIVLQGLGVLAS